MSDDEECRGVWRDGWLIVMSRYARLPSRCLKCNAPATTRMAGRLSWHGPIVYLWLLAGLLPYFVASAMTRKSAAIEIPYCDRHRKIRRWNMGLALAIIGGCLVLTAVGLTEVPEYAVLIPISAVLALIGGGYAAWAARPVGVERIDDDHVWLKGICSDYLASLPGVPTPMTASTAIPPGSAIRATP